MTIPVALDFTKNLLYKNGFISNLEIANFSETDDQMLKGEFLDQIRNQLIQSNYAVDNNQLGLALPQGSQNLDYDVFISYARKDNNNQRLDELYGLLINQFYNKSGLTLRVFYDIKEIDGGDNWKLRLSDGIAQSKIMLPVVSPNYFESYYCFWEWEKYYQQEIGIGLFNEGILPINILATSLKEPKSTEEANWQSNVLKERQFINLEKWYSNSSSDSDLNDVLSIQKVGDFCLSRVQKIKRIILSKSRLPAHFRHFYGRVEELKEILEIFNIKTPPVVTLYGIKGIGKSTLAYEYALAYGERYQGGRFLVNASGMHSIVAELKRLMILEFGWEFSELENKDDCLAYVRIKRQFEKSYFESSDNCCLIVFDNVDSVDKLFSTNNITYQIPHGIHILLTTRIKPEETQSLKVHQVNNISGNASLQLLSSYRAYVNEVDKSFALKIVEKIGGYPIALNLAGSLLQKNKNYTYSSFLEQVEKDIIGTLDIIGSDKLGLQLYLYEEKMVTNLLTPLIAGLSVVQRKAILYASLLPSDAVALPWIEELLNEDFPELLPTSGEKNFITEWDCIKLELFRVSIWIETENDQLVRMHRLLQDVVIRGMKIDQLETRILSMVLRQIENLPKNWYVKEARWAVEALRKYVPIAEIRFTDDDRLSSLQNQLGLIEQDFGNLIKAKELLEKSTQILVKIDPSHHDLVVRFSNLGLIEKDLGNLNMAKELIQAAVRIGENILDPDNLAIAINYSNLATLEVDLGSLEPAKILLEKALAHNRKYLSENHPSLIVNLANLATVEVTSGNSVHALTLMKEAVLIAESNYDTKDPLLCMIYHNLATTLKISGDLENAKKLIQKAIKIAVLHYDPEHSMMSNLYYNLALIEKSSGNFNSSKDLIERALKIDQRNYSSNHYLLIGRYSSLAKIELQLNNVDSAQTFIDRALEICKVNYNPNHPAFGSVYIVEAEIEKSKGNFQKAKFLMNNAIDNVTHNITWAENSLSECYLLLSIIELELGNVRAAKNFGEKALDGFNEDKNIMNVSVCNCYFNLSNIEKALGNKVAAKNYMEKSIEAIKPKQNPDHYTLANGYATLSMMEKELGNLEAAKYLVNRAIAIDIANLDTQYEFLPHHYSYASIIEHALGNFLVAKNLIEKAIKSMPDNPSYHLGMFYWNLSQLEFSIGNKIASKMQGDIALNICKKCLDPSHRVFAKFNIYFKTHFNQG